MCKVIAIANQKGGVSKTTTCLNLGIALANAGKRVLLVDNDPQGSMTESLGFHNPDEMDETLATAIFDMLKADDNLSQGRGGLGISDGKRKPGDNLSQRRDDPNGSYERLKPHDKLSQGCGGLRNLDGKKEPGDNLSQALGSRNDSDEPMKPHDKLSQEWGCSDESNHNSSDYVGIRTMRHIEGVDLIPGNIELAGLEVTLVNVMCRESILRELLLDLQEDYDYVLIDCMPSLGMLTINALVAADSVLIPCCPAYLPAKGLELLLLTISKVRRQLNRKLKIEGILLSMVDSRTNFSKEIIELIQESYGTNVRIFDTKIPFSVRAAEASAEGVSIFVHDPKGKVAAAYRNLMGEVIGNGIR